MTKQGLYANIHAKRQRIKDGSGEKMRKVGSKGSPTKKDFVQSAKTAKKPVKARQGGYAKGSAVVRASELQNPQKFPLVAQAIESERRAIVERYQCTQERSLSTLARIRDKASEAGNWNAAVAAETRRGQIAGLYVDKKEILTGSIDSMNREDVEAKIDQLKKQYSIETTFEELKEVKQIENKS